MTALIQPSTRDTIVPDTPARKAGWNDVTFLGSAAAYDAVDGLAQNEKRLRLAERAMDSGAVLVAELRERAE